jgi:polar amino acid transport system substrate-binding protein
MSTATHARRRMVGLIAVGLLATTALVACGSDTKSSAATTAGTTAGTASAAATTVAAGATTSAAGAATTTAAGGKLNLTADQARIVPAKIDAIAAEVPDSIRKTGKLVIGVGAAGAGFPPLAFAATDNTTLIGTEPDIAVLVAGVLGLEPDIQNSSWENLFIGLDSGAFDIGFSNITDTEERKKKYDFASYREDNLAFEALDEADWSFTKAEDLAGKTVAVGSGTNQEKLLLGYADTVKAAGLDAVTIKYFQDASAAYLALGSGQVDAYFGPNPTSAYHVSTSGQTKIIGAVSGAGSTLQGLIAATTKKDNGLVKAVNDALNAVIKSGDYAKVLDRWNLANEAVTTSQINPPGLPLTNS